MSRNLSECCEYFDNCVQVTIRENSDIYSHNLFSRSIKNITLIRQNY